MFSLKTIFISNYTHIQLHGNMHKYIDIAVSTKRY